METDSFGQKQVTRPGSTTQNRVSQGIQHSLGEPGSFAGLAGVYLVGWWLLVFFVGQGFLVARPRLPIEPAKCFGAYFSCLCRLLLNNGSSRRDWKTLLPGTDSSIRPSLDSGTSSNQYRIKDIWSL